MLLLWSLIGIFTGIVFGIIPGAGPFLAIATLYPLLYYADTVSILAFYIALIITCNYTNSVTSILYGIPGDPTAAVTARHGHKMMLDGHGHLAVSSNAISSTIGSIFAIGLFLVFLPSIFSIFKFYNSTIQLAIVSLAIILLAAISRQKLWKTILLFILGGIFAKIGFDNLTHKTWGTFGIDYLTLGIPFSSMMIGLYILPEVMKFKEINFAEENKITKFGYSLKTLPSTLFGSFVGFWCGLVPGVTNILGSYLSASFVKKDINKIATAESANNSGALSSVLPLIVLGIPIVSSEILIYYLVASKGFRFELESLYEFTPILFCIPLVLFICLFLCWLGFNQLAKITEVYKTYKNYFSIIIILIISLMSLYIYPIKTWLLISLVCLCILGYFIRKWDTFPVLYGYFLTDLFWDNLIRVIAVYT
tara:strand:+ start:146 stop:1411 length:1266 start_codon:yes stop_codon:yes gene_type:complete